MVYLYDACDQISDFCHQQLLRKMRRKISWTDGRTDRGKIVYPPLPSGSGGIIINTIWYIEPRAKTWSWFLKSSKYHMTSVMQKCKSWFEKGKTFSRVKPTLPSWWWISNSNTCINKQLKNLHRFVSKRPHTITKINDNIKHGKYNSRVNECS